MSTTLKQNSFGPQPALQHITRAFEQSRKTLARLIARIVKPHDVEDIVQETYIRIYQASRTQPIRHARALMLHTARNLALNHVTRADALNHLDSTVEDLPEHSELVQMEESPEAILQAREELLLFCRSLRDLSPQCRRAFILRKVYDLPQRDVARRLGIAESTVEKHVARGLMACSDYLRAHGYPRLTQKESRQTSPSKTRASR